MLAIVGSRRMTTYGKSVLGELIPPLARAGITIISGLALGADGEAHKRALACGGTTVAVLPGGVDDAVIAPPSHKPLAHRMLEAGGALVSEQEPGTDVRPYHFPVRNRILSGLAIGTLVVEAAEKSGSLITAHLAAEQNRDVFAVPGDVFRETSAGCNKLIRSGAIPVRHAGDILEALNMNASPSKAAAPLRPATPEEAAVLPHIGRTPQAIDELVRVSKLSAQTVTHALSLLEISGLVERLPGGLFRLAHRTS